MKISEDLIMYGACTRIARSALAIAKEKKFTNITYAVQEHVSDVLDYFESQMLRKGKSHYSLLVKFLRDRTNEEFNKLINKSKIDKLEAIKWKL